MKCEDLTPNLRKLFIGILVSLSTIIVLLILVIIYDRYLNNKFHNRGGFNYRGYRGKIVGKKRPDEIRIGIFGGSVAMGYGVHYSKSIAAFLGTLINSKDFKKKYTVINLAAADDAMCGFLKDTYNLFSYLDIDVIVFYFTVETEDEKFIQNKHAKRSANYCLKHFSYYFVAPTVLREKYYLIRYGNISDGYRKDKIFRKMDDITTQLFFAPSDKTEEELSSFVSRLTSQGKVFIFIIPPIGVYEDQRRVDRLKSYLRSTFGDNPLVITMALEDTFSKDNLLVYFLDGTHHNEKGNQRVAEELFKYIPFSIFEDET